MAARTSCSRRARPRRPSTAWLPDRGHVRLTDRVSVAHYLDRVHVPVFLIQGENDTLFNLQEAAATYRGTEVAGRPGGDGLAVVGALGREQRAQRAAPGELDLSGQDIEGTYLGSRIKKLVRPLPQGHQGTHGSGVRLLPGLGLLHRQRRARLRHRRLVPRTGPPDLVPLGRG